MTGPRVLDVRAGFAHAQIIVGTVITVVDPGNADVVASTLAREGLALSTVRRIVLTHGDGDHWGGAAALAEQTGAEVVAHSAERPYLDGTVIPRFSLPKQLLIRVGSRAARRPTIGRWLHDGDLLDDLEVLHTPGHTPGHICLRVGTTLIAGDAFSTGERFREVPRLMTADLARSRDSIRTLARLDITRALSGHGSPSDDAGERLRALAARLGA